MSRHFVEFCIPTRFDAEECKLAEFSSFGCLEIYFEMWCKDEHLELRRI